MGSDTAGFEKGTSARCTNTVAAGGVYTVSTNFAGCPSAGGGSGEEICICDRAVTDSHHSLSRLLNRTDVESLQLEQIEVILNEEKDTLETWTKVNEERLGRLNSFGYPSLVDEQGKIQKELTRLQNIKKLTEEQSKSKQDIEKLEKEVTVCTQQLAEQDTVVKALQRLYENARMAVGKDVKALRQQLQEGEACPVCGSTTHPYHREQEVVDTLYRNMEQEYNTAVSAYQQINNRSIALQRDLTHQRATEVQIKEQLSVFATRRIAGWRGRSDTESVK